MSPFNNIQHHLDVRCNRRAKTIAGGNGQGGRLDELNCPYGICFDDEEQMIYIADCWNHRIIEWRLKEKCCRIAAGGNGKGNRSNQLHCPIDVILDRENDSLLISDYENRRVIRWPRHRHSSGRILHSNIDCGYLAMHRDGTLYVSNWKKNEVKRWKTGEIYVVDHGNNRVLRWCEGEKEETVVLGGNGEGKQADQLNYPIGLSMDREGNIYVADMWNHRIQTFSKYHIEEMRARGSAV